MRSLKLIDFYLALLYQKSGVCFRFLTFFTVFCKFIACWWRFYHLEPGGLGPLTEFWAAAPRVQARALMLNRIFRRAMRWGREIVKKNPPEHGPDVLALPKPLILLLLPSSVLLLPSSVLLLASSFCAQPAINPVSRTYFCKSYSVRLT
jgi:hypothetical protein